MQIGVIGLGRMGTGTAKRLLQANHAIVGFDVSPAHVEQVVQTGAAGARSLQDLVRQLAPPRTVWLMVPHGAPTRTTIEALLPLLTPEDIVIDGGNSRYTDSVAHAARCREHGVHFLDVGVSGGVWGLAEGFNLMIGGTYEVFSRLESVFQSLAPPGGYAHVGPSGAGHFVKMIHNAIEYAMLQALGEGFECLERSEFNLDLTPHPIAAGGTCCIVSTVKGRQSRHCSVGNSRALAKLLESRYGYVHHLPSNGWSVCAPGVRRGRTCRDGPERRRRSDVACCRLGHWGGRTCRPGGATRVVVAVQRPTGYAMAARNDRDDRGESCGIVGPTRSRSHGDRQRIGIQSCRTTVSRELFTVMSPLYSMNPRSRNLFMKKLTRDRVVPTISASVSCDILGMGSGRSAFP